ncbi:MAG: hypothetical protein AAGJ93_05045, partial [Bacteroidota bacterium]
MNQTEAIKKIRASLEDGKTEDALEQLVQFLKGVNAPSQDDAILLLGQFKQWQRESRIGAQQSNEELRRIELSIMEMIRDEDLTTSSVGQRRYGSTQTGHSNQGNNKTNSFLYTIIGGLVVLVGVMFFIMSSDDKQKNDPIPTPTEKIADDNQRDKNEDVAPANEANTGNPSMTNTSTPSTEVINSTYSIEPVSGDK